MFVVKHNYTNEEKKTLQTKMANKLVMHCMRTYTMRTLHVNNVQYIEIAGNIKQVLLGQNI